MESIMRTLYEYIFWDLDGTLLNTYEGIFGGLTYALGFFGIRENDVSVIRRFIGPPLREILPEEYGFSPEQTEVCVDKYREFYLDGGMFLSEPYPDVPALLDVFHQAGAMQAVTSSKPEIMCKKILARRKLDYKFDLIAGASLDGKRDTKAEVLEDAMVRLSISDRSRVVLIGDTKYDAEGAREVGIDCIGTTWGFGSREEMLPFAPLAVVDTPEEVKAILLK